MQVDVEKNLIASILLEPECVSGLDVEGYMFSTDIYRQIFEHCRALDDKGLEINTLRIAKALVTPYMSLVQVNEFLADIIDSKDASISDEYCCKELRKKFRASKAKEILERVELTPDNVDSVLDELIDDFDGIKETKSKEAVKMSELVKYRGDYFRDKEIIYDTGISSIDDNIGSFDSGDLIIIAARPSVGKSALALQIARRFGRNGLKTAYFNLEMTEKQMYERAVASASGINMKRIRNATNFLGDEKEKFDKGNDLLMQEDNLYIYDGNFRVRDIRAAQKKHRFKAIFVDYLQLVSPDRVRSNRREEVGAISRGLKRIGMENNIPVFALSQLNRMSEMNKDKEPSMAELREAGDIEQDASTIIMLWNPNKEDSTTKMIKIEKGRQTGNSRQQLKFDGSKMLFYENDFEDASEDMEIPFEFD